jgi:hypothetical protein
MYLRMRHLLKDTFFHGYAAAASQEVTNVEVSWPEETPNN